MRFLLFSREKKVGQGRKTPLSAKKEKGKQPFLRRSSSSCTNCERYFLHNEQGEAKKAYKNKEREKSVSFFTHKVFFFTLCLAAKYSKIKMVQSPIYRIF